MFGNLRIDDAALTPAEQESYRAAFCASCHAMRGFSGRVSALLANYDQTVLALVLAGLQRNGEPEGLPCTALPLRTVAVWPIARPGREFLAAANLATIVAKLHDDVADDGRWRSRAALRLLRGRHARSTAALRALAFPVSLFTELPARQAEREAEPSPNLATLAAPTAELSGQLFGHAARLSGRREDAAALVAFGASLGRFVYAWDAFRDLRADVRLGRFNALVAAFGGHRFGGPLRAFLLEQVTTAERSLDRIDLGMAGRVIAGLLTSLRRRCERALAPDAQMAAAEPRLRLAEAGDCDACAAVECCGSSGDAASCCSCCECCCWWTDAGKRRRVTRAERAARRHGEGEGSVDLTPLIGQRGVAVTDLLPEGRVRVLRLEYDARCDETAMIPQGAKIVVRAIDRGRLIVVNA